MNPSTTTSARARRTGKHASRLCALALACATTLAWAADQASGSITLGKRSAQIQHATLVRGPDEMTGKTLLRLYLSTADISAAIKACKTLSCADGALTRSA